ncbi:molybdenum cofactor guanylyltransferase [Tenacibaculum agarivorans]|uniref:molybdenum cofactor guanylyltransferase n=1 Tax=Tenacibaculum agarivorans TaxID=1908389 RepID=UPI00135652FC|nr:molybdenum cofactor guanylyltransferase [Tenacibaculum agarivorans]
MIKKENITGIVLAGGKSSRMGKDKSLLLLKNKPLISYSIDALLPVTNEIIIVSDYEKHEALGYKRTKDEIPDFGPVSGIYSGLKASTTPYNLILSCDIPLVQTKILQTLLNEIENDFEIIMIESEKKAMPLIALYSKKCEDKFYQAIQNKQHRLMHVVSECKTKRIALSEEEKILTSNVNTPYELELVKNYLSLS